MIIEIKVPPLGESISSANIASWLVKNGDSVLKNQDLVEIDSDKATLAVSAEESGEITIFKEAGAKVGIGDVIGQIDTSKAIEKSQKEEIIKLTETKPVILDKKQEVEKSTEKHLVLDDLKVSVSPVADRMIQEDGLEINEILNHKLLRITRQDVENYKKTPLVSTITSRDETRKEMTALRKKLAERLVQSKNQTAMLTTFNEVDMSNILEIRKQFGKDFQDKHGVKLGFMSFFTKAAAYALKEIPEINASIEGDEIVYHNYMDIGIAVSSPKGLVVPVIRNAENYNLPEMEKAILTLAEKARNKRLSIDEMTGGTFTITNGGVFGSLMSTPIINPPQVAILGMHKIQERPVGIDGKIELRPMMYLALSYDHRIVDGKEAVTFLIRIKEILENPISLLSDGKDPIKEVLGL